jgi:hypothetical protein
MRRVAGYLFGFIKPDTLQRGRPLGRLVSVR